MDEEITQSGLAPETTRLRLGGRSWEMPDPVWELMVRQGRVPPNALVLSHAWTKGVWRRAGSLEVYHLFLPAGPGQSPGAEAGSPAGEEAQSSGLPVAVWGPGVSVTQLLILANLVISAALVFFWRDDFSSNLWHLSAHLRAALLSGWIPVLLVPLFLHASSGHLLGNMIGLTAGGAAVEEFYGRSRTLLLYFIAGLSGAGLSLLKGNPVLSVGASGAIMGLYGVVLVFLFRYRSRFSERQRFKTTRVYFPLLVLALLPSLFMADVYAHVGGFLGGVLAATVITPPRGRVPWIPRSPGAKHPEPNPKATAMEDDPSRR